MTEYPTPAFYFKIEYGKVEMSFQEVSGLDSSSSLKNGIKHAPIRFKKGLCQNGKSFQEIYDALNNLDKILVKNLTISLLNSDAEVIRAWQCLHAYPIKFELDTLKYTSDFLAIENLEMEYSVIKRTK
ncbi:phage tail protein [Aquirufa aurantiipilula]